MEFNEKLQTLRKSKELTQEQLAESLFVSRTAISKWESGRGYPNIDSLKEISRFFSISLDELLSNEEILNLAEQDSKQKVRHFCDLVFGLLDISVGMFIFLPLFGKRAGGVIQESSLLSLSGIEQYVIIPYYIIILGLVICGALTLALQSSSNAIWLHTKSKISLGLSAIGTLIFMMSLQPYIAMFTFLFLIIKSLMLIKWA